MVAASKTRFADPIKVEEAEQEILAYSRTVKFTVTEYSFEFIVEKLKSERYYVPNYQRNLIWNQAKKSKFIESVFMGLPIPFVFFWQDKDGRMEIVDGSQRLRTIHEFMASKFRLKGLETIPAANGLRFSDFSKSRQLKFSETPIRVIILDNTTDAVTRTEMFARINTGGTTANDAEIRRGSLPGPFMDLIVELAEDPLFIRLTPISKPLVEKREREELITRFFAYSNNFDLTLNHGNGDIVGYKEEPRRFYYKFVKEMNDKTQAEIDEFGNSLTLEGMKIEFRRTLHFVEKTSPFGFTKSKTGNQVPRVRFEAIAVGANLALRENEDIFERVADMSPLTNSPEFATSITSDAANVKSKLLRRVRMVYDWLVAQ